MLRALIGFAAASAGSASVRRGLYSSSEHNLLGNSVKFADTLLDGTPFTFDGSKSVPLPKGRGAATYGETLLACGDVYAGDTNSVKNPVCTGGIQADQEKRFTTMFDSLGEVGGGHLKSFKETVAAAITGSLVLDSLINPIWLLYVSNNIDHFTKAAKIPGPPASPACGNFQAYSAGHRLALKAARDATSLKGAANSLERALMINACACHFLSDAFAAGHIRTPAQQLFFHGDDAEWKLTKNIDGLLAMHMHDNDNGMGLEVQNAKGEQWRSYGDGCLNIPQNIDNKNRQIKTLTISAQEVFEAYKTSTLRGGDGKITKIFDVASEVPSNAKLTDLAWSKANGNSAPMFYADWDAAQKKTIVKRRKDLTNYSDYSFVTIEEDDWSAVGFMDYVSCTECNDPSSCKVAYGTKKYIVLAIVLGIIGSILLCCCCCYCCKRCKKSNPNPDPTPDQESDQESDDSPVSYGQTEAYLEK